MRLTEHVYLVGSGLMGMNQTDPYDCNVYLLNTGDTYVLIDSGAGRNPQAIIDEVVSDGLDPQNIAYIVTTHAHADHSGGAHALQELTGATVLGGRETVRILKANDEEAIQLSKARRDGTYPEDYVWKGCQQAEEITEGETLTVGPFTLEWIHTPGHSFDMVSCYVKELKAMFCADTVFAGGKIAALSTPDFSLPQLAESIATLSRFEVEDLFPGHLDPVLRMGGDAIQTAHRTFLSSNVPASIV